MGDWKEKKRIRERERGFGEKDGRRNMRGVLNRLKERERYDRQRRKKERGRKGKRKKKVCF